MLLLLLFQTQLTKTQCVCPHDATTMLVLRLTYTPTVFMCRQNSPARETWDKRGKTPKKTKSDAYASLFHTNTPAEFFPLIQDQFLLIPVMQSPLLSPDSSAAQAIVIEGILSVNTFLNPSQPNPHQQAARPSSQFAPPCGNPRPLVTVNFSPLPVPSSFAPQDASGIDLEGHLGLWQTT